MAAHVYQSASFTSRYRACSPGPCVMWSQLQEWRLIGQRKGSTLSPPGTSQLPGADWLQWFRTWRKRERFVPTKTDIYSQYRFAFPGCVFASITICGLSERFIHHHGILYNVAPGQRTHFTTKEAQQWVCPWNSLALPHDYHSEAVSLQE